jgi:REP element-mobilizing transposase RayT
MLDPLGWLLTWTTYGTWLQGDARGSYDRKGRRPGTKFIAPDIRFEALRRSQLKHPEVLIDPPMRRVIRLAIEAECAFQKWTLLALNVRTNHVHAVLPAIVQPARMLQAIKSAATQDVRKQGLLDQTQPIWTSGGSKTWLLDEQERANAIDYVKNQQGPDLPEA